MRYSVDLDGAVFEIVCVKSRKVETYIVSNQMHVLYQIGSL